MAITIKGIVTPSNEHLLEDELASAMSRELRDEIDWSIILSLLMQVGWTLIYVDPKHQIQISNWLIENSITDYQHRNGHYLFKEPKDATAFALKWK